MKKKGRTQPHVFIIESLDHEDEDSRKEGEILSRMLRLAERECEYFYIRTRKEFEWAIKLFGESKYRYLHISCHGSKRSLHTTLESISFEEVGKILRPHLSKKRLFLSACGAAKKCFADAVEPGSGIASILGPTEDVLFSDAAVFWASFYALMFKKSDTGMNPRALQETAATLADLYGVNFALFHRTRSGGFRKFPLSVEVNLRGDD